MKYRFPTSRRTAPLAASGPRVGDLRCEDLEIDRPLEAAELADGRVHVSGLGVLHPDRHVLVHDQAQERQEDEDGHDRTHGRGDPTVVPPDRANYHTHGVASRVSSGGTARAILKYAIYRCRGKSRAVRMTLFPP